jgi:hypothetical protein
MLMSSTFHVRSSALIFPNMEAASSVMSSVVLVGRSLSGSSQIAFSIWIADSFGASAGAVSVTVRTSTRSSVAMSAFRKR